MAHDPRLTALCRRIKASDREAFATVFAVMRADLVRYVDATINDGTIAHDLVQDVFIGLWERRTKLDPSQPLKALLFRMARNRALNHLRHARVRRRYSAPVTEPVAPAAPPEMDAPLLHDRLRAYITALPDRQREAIELTRFAALSHREAAEVMEISPRTLNNHIVRALATLSERLQALDADITAAS